jgi:hypothetical protein
MWFIFIQNFENKVTDSLSKEVSNKTKIQHSVPLRGRTRNSRERKF